MRKTKTIGILAHVDAGKKTFAEQILYHTQSIRNLGRVDHMDSSLDNHDIEKKRGITIFADQAVFSYNHSNYYLIDTPGHVDFSAEMERSLQVMDYAIVIISAVEGLQGHTEVKGYGHFEPLKHYAEVHLKIEPARRNSGITFENECHPDDLNVGYQNLVRHHLFEREHHGLLTGSALTDVKVTLLTGRAHNKHTSGGDFREATYRALRQGLEKAKNIVLERYYHFKIKVDVKHMGRVIADIQSLYGDFDTPETVGDKAVITGKAPVTTFMEYSMSLASFSHGKGAIMLKFAGYYPCHNDKEVIEHIGYNKKADPDYTSSSIFCAKGTGYSVPWDEAEQKMHAL